MDLAYRSYPSARRSNLSELDIVKKAIELFEEQLRELRKIIPVTSICMHGSPLSPFDNRLLWKYHHYREFNIETEPYFDLDFSETLNLTDTGRKWNGQKTSVRDKLIIPESGKDGSTQNTAYSDWKVIPKKNSAMNLTDSAVSFQNNYSYHRSFNIISDAAGQNLPSSLSVTVHPQRWTDNNFLWCKEYLLQNVKNIGKYYLLKYRGS